MKGKALRKHNLHGKITCSVLLKHFISGDERYHNVNPQKQLRTNCSACLIIFKSNTHEGLSPNYMGSTSFMTASVPNNTCK